MSAYVGIDGGGTKTQVLVMTEQCTATAVGASSNPNVVGWANAEQVILALIADCLNELHLSSADVAALSVCMSGVDRIDESTRLRNTFQRQFAQAWIEVKNDALAALAAGTKGKPGVVLIAGTGSIAVGESHTGQTARAGGYGYLLGDEGSGFTIGRAGLLAAIQGAEGRAQKTLLWDRAAAVYSITHPNALIPVVYRSEKPVNTVAEFAKEVVSLAHQDAVANDIIRNVIAEYSQLIHSVMNALDRLHGCTVVLAGGLFTNSAVLAERLKVAEPQLRFEVLSQSAASGATLRAVKGFYLSNGLSESDAIHLWQSNIGVE